MCVMTAEATGLEILQSNPPKPSIIASGCITLPGWRNPKLALLEMSLSRDDTLGFEFAADLANDTSLPEITSIVGQPVWKRAVEGVVGVRVVTDRELRDSPPSYERTCQPQCVSLPRPDQIADGSTRGDPRFI